MAVDWDNHQERFERRTAVRRHLTLLLFIAVILVFPVSDLLAQPDHILLNHPEVFKKRERPPVGFPHDRHMGGDLSCTDCHHQYENGKNVLDESTLQTGNKGIRCSACHGTKQRIDLQRAFHYQCLSCHKKRGGERKTTGPRFCGECHLRKQKPSPEKKS